MSAASQDLSKDVVIINKAKAKTMSVRTCDLLPDASCNEASHQVRECAYLRALVADYFLDCSSDAHISAASQPTIRRQWLGDDGQGTSVRRHQSGDISQGTTVRGHQSGDDD